MPKPKLERKIEVTCEAAPLQIEGHLGGFPFYFRARFNHWSFTIVEPGADPVGRPELTKLVFDRTRPFGVWPCAASWMPVALGRQIVRRMLDRSEYLVQQRITKNAR